VNNNEGQPADYTKLQEAIDAASPSDSIYVVGSQTSHGNITINKKITLIGPGYFLVENKNVEEDEIQTQANLETAKINFLTIDKDGDDTSVIGIDFSSINSNTIIVSTDCQNVELLRNRIIHLILRGANTVVSKNFIIGQVIIEGASNSIIRNNIILGNLSRHIDLQMESAEIINNTFTSGLNFINNANIDNNIFTNDNPLNNCTNNTFKHNIFTGTEENIFSGNQKNNTYIGLENKFGQPLGQLFVTSEQTLDRDYQLAENSPAKGAGTDGVDAGAFSSDNNSYRRSGLPAIPAIYEISTIGVGTPNTGMKVTIKAKSNL
jgi:hypothetical protein